MLFSCTLWPCLIGTYFSIHYLAPNALLAHATTNYSRKGDTRCYDESEAHNLNHKGDEVTWSVISFVKNQNELFINNGKLSKVKLNYFLSIGSKYLVLHIKDKIIIDREFKISKYNPKNLSPVSTSPIMNCVECISALSLTMKAIQK